MDILTKDAILNVEDIQYAIVPTPEWGGDSRVKSLMANERDYIESLFTSDKPETLRNVRATVAAFGLVDENGERLFKSRDEIRKLGKKNAIVIDRLFDKIREMSGMTEDAVKDVVENLEEGQGEDLASD